MFTIPIGVDFRLLRPAPATWVLIALCCLAYGWQTGGSANAAHTLAYSLGVVPAILVGEARLPPELVMVPGPATLVTALFLHGSWLHLASNMVFLCIFGRPLEAAIGTLRYVVFYLTAGILSCLAQVAAAPASEVPMIGASGAIAGVLGGFLWQFPAARVRLLLIVIVFFKVIKVPALLMLGLWFAGQVVGAAAAPAETGGIAFWAHLGGFAAGLAFLPILARGPFPLYEMMARRRRARGAFRPPRGRVPESRGPGPGKESA